MRQAGDALCLATVEPVLDMQVATPSRLRKLSNSFFPRKAGGSILLLLLSVWQIETKNNEASLR